MSMFNIPEEFMPSMGKSPFAAFDMPKWFDAYEMKMPGFDFSAFTTNMPSMNMPAMPEPAVAAMLPATAMALAPASVIGYWTGLFEVMSGGMMSGSMMAGMTGGEKARTPEPAMAIAAPAATKAGEIAGEAVTEAAAVAGEEAAPAETPRKQSSWKSAIGKVKLARTSIESRPSGLEAPRDGKGDDLQLIAGVGPKIETILHDLGIYHYDQIAAWTGREIEWVDDYLKFSGRITREDWISQAAALAKGGRDEYVKVFGKEPR